jgi:hypothetical protein
MYAYAPDNPVELDIEFGEPSSERPKYEIIIISVSDVQITLGFILGHLSLLIATRSSEDAKHEID